MTEPMRGLKMLSMEKGLVFLELSTRTDGLTDSLTKDKPVELFPVFKACLLYTSPSPRDRG